MLQGFVLSTWHYTRPMLVSWHKIEQVEARTLDWQNQKTYPTLADTVYSIVYQA